MGGPADDKPRAPRAGTPLPPRAGTPLGAKGGDGGAGKTGQEGNAGSKSVRPGGATSLIGSTISDRYLIEKLLGEGGMGAVYQAEHTLMRKRMAIKVLHPEMTRLPEVVQRFEREAMAAAHIDHPNVVTATDFGKLDDGSFFLALEFVDGPSLREIIGIGRLEIGRALHIARQMAAALQRAHLLKIVHRDLKPENVMLVERDGDPDFVKVLDFGIAKVQMGELGTNDRAGPDQNLLTQAGMVYGTPEYMAPEQALGQPVDARADLYALGIIMYEMLTGHRPFEAESKVALLGMQVTAPVPAMITKCADCNVPLEVEVLVGRLLAKEASERIGDAKDVIEGITNILVSLASTGAIDPRFAPPPVSGGNRMTNPGIISGISPSPPELSKNKAPLPADTKVDGLLGGRGWILAMVAGILGLLVLVSTIVYVLKDRDPSATKDNDASALVTTGDAGPTSVAPDSTDDRVKEAIGMIDRGDYGSGIKRLDDLGEAVQSREDVHRALLTAYNQTERPKEAMREAGLILKGNPDLVLKDEVKLRVEVRNIAVREGLSKDPVVKAAVDEAFGLFEKEMGTIGWDDLYDIAYLSAYTAQYPKAAARARASFARGERSRMSPALTVALDLQNAGASCAAKTYFERAEKDGDNRALNLLKNLTTAHQIKQQGFKKIDLLGCLHDGQLARTINVIEQRLASKKK